MAYRQYIGARYVPLYDGTWDATKNYAPLTIVDDANGNSFTSKKDVPAGTPLTDRSFWVQTSSFSGAIQQLQDRMTNAESDIDNLQAEDVNINQRIDSNDADISQLESDVTQLESDVTKLMENVKHLWYVGDSFLGLSPNFGGIIDNYFGLNDSVYTYDGGIGFVNLGNNTGVNLAQLVRQSTEDVSAVTDVVVIAGINDCKSENFQNLDAAILDTIAAIRTKNATAKIYVSFNGTYQDPSYSDYANRLPWIGEVYRAMINATLKAGENVCFMRSPAFSIQFRSALDQVGIHPNGTGSELLARSIINHLNGGGDVTTTFERRVNGMVFHVCDLDNVYLCGEMSQVLYSGNAISLNANAFNKIYDNSNIPVLPRNTYHFSFPAKLRFTLPGGVTEYRDAMILIRPSSQIDVFVYEAVSNATEIRFYDNSSRSVPLFCQTIS